jgi:hypothetical protein
MFPCAWLSTTPRGRIGEWRYSSSILELGTRGKWVVSFVPRPLHPRGKSSRYPMGRWREISCPCRELSPGRPARSPSQYWLSYPGCVCIKQIRIIFTANFSPICFRNKNRNSVLYKRKMKAYRNIPSVHIALDITDMSWRRISFLPSLRTYCRPLKRYYQF